MLQGRLGHTQQSATLKRRRAGLTGTRLPGDQSGHRSPGGDAEEKPGEGVAGGGRQENKEENTTPPDNSLAVESQTMRQRGNGAAAAVRAILAHFLYILYANQSLCLPSLIKQLYY